MMQGFMTERQLIKVLTQAAAGFATIANHSNEPAVKALALANFKACRNGLKEQEARIRVEASRRGIALASGHGVGRHAESIRKYGAD